MECFVFTRVHFPIQMSVPLITFKLHLFIMSDSNIPLGEYSSPPPLKIDSSNLALRSPRMRTLSPEIRDRVISISKSLQNFSFFQYFHLPVAHKVSLITVFFLDLI